jgi:hypothetical protein
MTKYYKVEVVKMNIGKSLCQGSLWRCDSWIVLYTDLNEMFHLSTSVYALVGISKALQPGAMRQIPMSLETCPFSIFPWR